MKTFLFITLVFVSVSVLAQVGINTVSPSEAAVLHIEAENANGSFGGFMPPRVNLSERNLIQVSPNDDGLMIYLIEGAKRCLQVYNSEDNEWLDFYCMPLTVVSFQQDFDTHTNWNYSSNVTFFQNGTDGYYDVTDGSSFSGINLTNNFFGIRDLDDEGNGTSGEGKLIFNTIDVSPIFDATLTFEYDSNDFNTTNDYFRYELFFDGASQGQVDLCTGCNDNRSGTVEENIPNTVSNLSLVITVKCNGGNDYVGFDNIKVE